MKAPSHYVRSVRHAALATMIAAASAVQACSSDTIPTEPTEATSITRASAPEPTEIRISGTVTDDKGVPIAGARVTVYRWTPQGEPRFTFTDGQGYYSIPIVSAAGISAWPEKQGYESKWHSHSLPFPSHFQFDLQMHRINQ